MPPQSSVLCPIDFSEPSLGALRYGAFVATHLGADLVAVTVEDPLVAEAHTLGGGLVWRPDDTRTDLASFVQRVVDDEGGAVAIDCEVATGKPAPEILRVAHERSTDLIVMSTSGVTGMRKLFFGSTTERVLRETTVPVLVTPPSDPGRVTLDGMSRGVQRVVVPIDFVSDASHLTGAASLIARALALPILLVHVIEPLRSPFAGRLRITQVDAERRARAEDALARIASALEGVRTEALVVYGDPAEELVKVARDRAAGLIVVGLHSSPVAGPRMGSVTYRILCLTRGLVLAIPPRAVSPAIAALAGMTADES